MSENSMKVWNELEGILKGQICKLREQEGISLTEEDEGTITARVRAFFDKLTALPEIEITLPYLFHDRVVEEIKEGIKPLFTLLLAEVVALNLLQVVFESRHNGNGIVTVDDLEWERLERGLMERAAKDMGQEVLPSEQADLIRKVFGRLKERHRKHATVSFSAAVQLPSRLTLEESEAIGKGLNRSLTAALQPIFSEMVLDMFTLETEKLVLEERLKRFEDQGTHNN